MDLLEVCVHAQADLYAEGTEEPKKPSLRQSMTPLHEALENLNFEVA